MSGSSSIIVVLLGVFFAMAGSTSPEEDKRKELIEKLGIPRKGKSKPQEPAPQPPAEPDPVEPTPPPQTDAPAPTEPTAPTVTYFGRVHKLLKSGCASCHRSGGSAGTTRFVLTGSVASDFRSALQFVKKNRPSASALLTKAAGKQHGGGSPFPSGSAKYGVLRDWIAEGAPKGGNDPHKAPAPIVAAPGASPSPEGTTTAAPKTTARKGGRARPRRPIAKRVPAAPPEPPDAVAPSPPDAATAIDPAAPSSPTETEPAAATPSKTAAAPSRPPRRAFSPAAHDVLLARCQSCHTTGLPAAHGGFALTGDATVDHPTTQRYVDTAAAADSRLLTKAIGREHGGGATLRTDSAGYRELLAWIEDGALGPTAADIPAEPATATGEATSPPVDVVTSASKRAEPSDRLGDGTPLPDASKHKSPLPFTLPWHLHLNGKLDFSYERREWKNHPFGPGSNAYQTYHHFLFLSRSGADDPFGFNVELITQAFYEFNARIAPRRRRFAFLFKAGKIMVPFGPEPLFHKSYGGRSGFDQEILPTIWAQPGIAANVHVRAGPIAISNDVYTVQGYALRSEDTMLNLQNDVSSIDDFKAAFGDRLGISAGPLSGWYSVQVNRLGFDRLLFMQAIDLELWRVPDVPVLKNLVLGLGGVRADVSGAGPGEDYYHFGSYGTVGYYPVGFLYLQYRAGLRTTDNRRGAFFDERRSDERDRSSHNISILGRYKGFYAGLQLFWNLEKANEQDDDFMRVTVGYEF
jgi:hypothetical protein